MDPKSFGKDDVAAFNDLSLLNDWMNERFSHENLEFINSDKKYVDKIAKRYNTKYFAWSGAITVREAKQDGLYYCMLSAFTVFGLPLGVYYLFKPEFESYYFFILFDVESGKALMVQKEVFNYRDRSDLLNSYIYDSFHQVHTKLKN